MSCIHAIGTQLSAARITLKEVEERRDALAERVRRLPEHEARTIECIHDSKANVEKIKAEEACRNIELSPKGEATLGLAKEGLQAGEVETSPGMTLIESCGCLRIPWPSGRCQAASLPRS